MTPTAPTPLREQLSALLTALWHDIDHKQGASAAAFFTADAELRFEDASFRGRAAIDDVYRTRAARGPRLSRHVLSNVHLHEVEENSVRVVSTLVLFAEDGHAPSAKTPPTLVADVWDKFERHGTTWLISSRCIRSLFLAADDELAVRVR